MISLLKRILLIILFVGLKPGLLFSQQFPLMEGYNVNPYNLSPAYAGLVNLKTLFIDYRSDWSGFDGSPKTYHLSYTDRLYFKGKHGISQYQEDIDKNSIGYGFSLIYDKTDIFSQTLFLATYTYEIKFRNDARVNFGLSIGAFKNSIDIGKYYNDPRYVEDMALLYAMQASKLKFDSDFSGLFRYKNMETGVLFSNIMFGTMRYRNTFLTYKPFRNFLFHSSYLIKLDDKWNFKPTLALRGGQNIPVQFEIAPAISWSNRFWGQLLFRTGGIMGAGMGGEIVSGVLLNYSHNIITNDLTVNAYGSNQITLGIKLFNSKQKKD